MGTVPSVTITERNAHQLLPRFVPAEAVEIIARWLQTYEVEIRVCRPRSTMLADYQPPDHRRGHRISINSDLNPYAFLITLVHEMAHRAVWQQYQDAVLPHGSEWKLHFRLLMDQFKGRRLFPASVTAAFRRHLLRPAFTHCTDVDLMRALQRYDRFSGFRLEQLMEGSIFLYKNKHFSRGKRRRKRIACICLETKCMYAFDPLTPVTPVYNQRSKHSL